MSQQKVCVLYALLLVANLSLAMDPTSPISLHQDSRGQGLRRDTNHASAPEERRRMDQTSLGLRKEGRKALLCASNQAIAPEEQVQLQQVAELNSARFDFFGRQRKYPLHDIACEVNLAKLDRSLDKMLWVLKNGEDREKKDDRDKTCVDYLNVKKFERGEIASHLVYLYYFEPTSDMVVRSGSFRLTYLQGMLQKPERVFCDCLEAVQAEPASEGMVKNPDHVVADILSVHPSQGVLKCSELQKDPAYVAWKKVFHNVVQLSEEQGKRLAKKWKPLLKDWSTFRIAQTLINDCEAQLFQFALLQDDYDLVSYMLQHKMVTRESIAWARENTFFARTVPMLKLLESYGVLTLSDDQKNNPFHHFAKHGRLLYPQVIDYYLQRDVDPLAKNDCGFTPLDLLVQYSHRFDGYESKLQMFIDMLLAKGAYKQGQRIQFRGDLVLLGILLRGGVYAEDGQHIQVADSLLEIARKNHAVWNLPATKLVVEALETQERSDARYAQFLKFRKAFAITYPHVEGDTPLHTVVKKMLQKHDRLAEFVPSFNEMGYEERLAFFQTDFKKIETLLRQGYPIASQNIQGRTIFHELCVDWHVRTKQRNILYRQLVRVIFTAQTKLREYHVSRTHQYDVCPANAFEEEPDIKLTIERLHTALAAKDNQGISAIDMVCSESKSCAHEDSDYWCVSDLLLGTTCTFKNRLISFLQVRNSVEVGEDYTWVLGLIERTKKNKEC